jgi:hypothetical protein
VSEVGDDGQSPDAIMGRCRANVAGYGWHATVVAADLDGGLPGFAYTTGLWATYGHPELAIVALAPQAAAIILRGAARRVAGGGALTDGGEYTELANPPAPGP